MPLHVRRAISHYRHERSILRTNNIRYAVNNFGYVQIQIQNTEEEHSAKKKIILYTIAIDKYNLTKFNRTRMRIRFNMEATRTLSSASYIHPKLR